MGKSCEREIFRPIEVPETEKYFMYPQGVCRIRKPAYAGNGCAIFPVFGTEEWAEKIRSQPQTIYSEVPLTSRLVSTTLRRMLPFSKSDTAAMTCS